MADLGGLSDNGTYENLKAGALGAGSFSRSGPECSQAARKVMSILN